MNLFKKLAIVALVCCGQSAFTMETEDVEPALNGLEGKISIDTRSGLANLDLSEFDTDADTGLWADMDNEMPVSHYRELLNSLELLKTNNPDDFRNLISIVNNYAWQRGLISEDLRRKINSPHFEPYSTGRKAILHMIRYRNLTVPSEPSDSYR